MSEPVSRPLRFGPLNDWVSSERILEHGSGRGTNHEAIVPTAQPSAGALVRWACRSDNRTRVGRVTLQRKDNVGIVVESPDANIKVCHCVHRSLAVPGGRSALYVTRAIVCVLGLPGSGT
jgi:hypothetical protein